MSTESTEDNTAASAWTGHNQLPISHSTKGEKLADIWNVNDDAPSIPPPQCPPTDNLANYIMEQLKGSNKSAATPASKSALSVTSAQSRDSVGSPERASNDPRYKPYNFSHEEGGPFPLDLSHEPPAPMPGLDGFGYPPMLGQPYMPYITSQSMFSDQRHPIQMDSEAETKGLAVPLPRVRIGSFNVPMYQETETRFNELFNATIQNISTNTAQSTRIDDFSMEPLYHHEPQPQKPIFPSLSAASTIYPTISDTHQATYFSRQASAMNLTNNNSPPSMVNNPMAMDAMPDVSRQADFIDRSMTIPSIGDESFVKYPSMLRSFTTNRFPKLCVCCPDGQHIETNDENNFGLSLPTASVQSDSRRPSINGYIPHQPSAFIPSNLDISNRIPLPLTSLNDSNFSWSCEQIDWNKPYTEPELHPSHIRQLLMFNMLTSERLLSPFELSVFRTVHCVGNCENARTPTRCWASHNLGTCNETKRWLRRNPFVYHYKHLLCPEIQSLKDSLKEAAKNNNNGGGSSDNQAQKFAEKLALQQACFRCKDGVDCQYSHSLEEQMYHPFVYKTAICNNQPDCVRPFCPFLHQGEYYTDENGNLRTRKYDSLSAWNEWKSNIRRSATLHSHEPDLDCHSFDPTMPQSSAIPLQNFPSNFSLGSTYSQGGFSAEYHPSWSMMAVPPESIKLDLDAPYELDEVDNATAVQFAAHLFTDCRKPLKVLELSVFRTTRCPHKSSCPNTKAPTKCWATHASNESNRWLRRNPFVHKYKHLLCPHVRSEKGNRENDGKARWLACSKGRNCNLAHSIEEQMYHPFVYKTSKCMNKTCERPFCPFLHDGENPRPLAHIVACHAACHSNNSSQTTQNAYHAVLSTSLSKSASGKLDEPKQSSTNRPNSISCPNDLYDAADVTSSSNTRQGRANNRGGTKSRNRKSAISKQTRK